MTVFRKPKLIRSDPHVRFGPIADILQCNRRDRFTPKADIQGRPLSPKKQTHTWRNLALKIGAVAMFEFFAGTTRTKIIPSGTWIGVLNQYV